MSITDQRDQRSRDTHTCTVVWAIDDFGEGKYFAACVRWYARICVNMDAIYVGMRGHNTSTDACEYIRRQEVCD